MNDDVNSKNRAILLEYKILPCIVFAVSIIGVSILLAMASIVSSTVILDKTYTYIRNDTSVLLKEHSMLNMTVVEMTNKITSSVYHDAVAWVLITGMPFIAVIIIFMRARLVEKPAKNASKQEAHAYTTLVKVISDRLNPTSMSFLLSSTLVITMFFVALHIEITLEYIGRVYDSAQSQACMCHNGTMNNMSVWKAPSYKILLFITSWSTSYFVITFIISLVAYVVSNKNNRSNPALLSMILSPIVSIVVWVVSYLSEVPKATA